MCLYKTHRFPKISRKPIQCYKVFSVCESERFELSTPVCGYWCNVGDTIKSKDCWVWGIFKSTLEGEVVHAYRIEAMANLSRSDCQCVCLCEILPFTPYWLGVGGEIGATKIKIIKKL